jgi:hypothetical protein
MVGWVSGYVLFISGLSFLVFGGFRSGALYTLPYLNNYPVLIGGQIVSKNLSVLFCCSNSRSR